MRGCTLEQRIIESKGYDALLLERLSNVVRFDLQMRMKGSRLFFWKCQVTTQLSFPVALSTTDLLEVAVEGALLELKPGLLACLGARTGMISLFCLVVEGPNHLKVSAESIIEKVTEEEPLAREGFKVYYNSYLLCP